MTIPVKPGPLTLDYPKWIPGEHGPTGSTLNIAGLSFWANGQPLQWRRDLTELFQFHVTVPAAANSVEIRFDYIDNIGALQEQESGQETTPNLAMVAWNHFLFYPDGELAQNISVQANIQMPDDWHFACALEPIAMSATSASFQTESLYTIVDSPLMTGAYFQKILLTPSGTTPFVELDIAADKPEDFESDDQMVQNMKSLTVQEETLFGSEHFRHYNFLFVLSDHIAENGLEHSESSEIAFPEDSFSDDRDFNENADTLSHEFFHSWNGKFRRPSGLATSDFITPEKTDLLWVYEGLTQYYGFVLAARSGLLTQDQVREAWAATLDGLDHEIGRDWRPLQDTADDAPELYAAPGNWTDYRRSVDYYEEGSVDWLQADAIIRTETHGTKSLDDFCRLFCSQTAPQTTAPVLKTYTDVDVFAALNKIAPYDWKKFWSGRLNGLASDDLDRAYLNAGWSLVYNDTVNSHVHEDVSENAGFLSDQNGSITDVNPTSLAFSAGLSPGMRIVAINGRPYSRDVLVAQFNASETSTTPLQLIIEEDDFYRVLNLNYHGGSQYPHLQRIPSAQDLLTQILTSLPASGAANK